MLHRCDGDTAHFLDDHGPLIANRVLGHPEEKYAGGEMLFDLYLGIWVAVGATLRGEEVGDADLSLHQLNQRARLILSWTSGVRGEG